jgi:hypothetical protein
MTDMKGVVDLQITLQRRTLRGAWLQMDASDEEQQVGSAGDVNCQGRVNQVDTVNRSKCRGNPVLITLSRANPKHPLDG